MEARRKIQVFLILLSKFAPIRQVGIFNQKKSIFRPNDNNLCLKIQFQSFLWDRKLLLKRK